MSAAVAFGAARVPGGDVTCVVVIAADGLAKRTGIGVGGFLRMAGRVLHRCGHLLATRRHCVVAFRHPGPRSTGIADPVDEQQERQQASQESGGSRHADTLRPPPTRRVNFSRTRPIAGFGPAGDKRKRPPCGSLQNTLKSGVPTGIRTPVASVKGRCPGPLDDGDAEIVLPLKSRGPCGIWWSQAGSNRRPPACHAGALPAELWPHGLEARQFREHCQGRQHPGHDQQSGSASPRHGPAPPGNPATCPGRCSSATDG